MGDMQLPAVSLVIDGQPSEAITYGYCFSEYGYSIYLAYKSASRLEPLFNKYTAVYGIPDRVVVNLDKYQGIYDMPYKHEHRVHMYSDVENTRMDRFMADAGTVGILDHHGYLQYKTLVDMSAVSLHIQGSRVDTKIEVDTLQVPSNSL